MPPGGSGGRVPSGPAGLPAPFCLGTRSRRSARSWLCRPRRGCHPTRAAHGRSVGRRPLPRHRRQPPGGPLMPGDNPPDARRTPSERPQAARRTTAGLSGRPARRLVSSSPFRGSMSVDSCPKGREGKQRTSRPPATTGILSGRWRSGAGLTIDDRGGPPWWGPPSSLEGPAARRSGGPAARRAGSPAGRRRRLSSGAGRSGRTGRRAGRRARTGGDRRPRCCGPVR